MNRQEIDELIELAVSPCDVLARLIFADEFYSDEIDPDASIIEEYL